MTDPLHAAALAAAIPIGVALATAIDAIIARIAHAPSRIERTAMVYAKAVVYEVREALKELVHDEVREALRAHERDAAKARARAAK